MIQDSEFNTVAQLSHFGAGLAAIWGSIVLFGGQPAMWYAVISCVVLAGLKEFWYDYKYETVDVRGSSLEDFTFYMVGVFTAVISVYVKNWLSY